MSGTNGPQAETTTTAEERKPPTLADIVREKTDDGRRIIDFFLDVMEARVEGAELCHRMDAARQLVKYGSRDAARFIARYRGVPCGHSTRGRRVPADPCSGAEDTPVAATLDPSSPLTQDFLTVLSAVDEDLMVRLIRAQTVDGGTIIEFLDDVMQDRNEGFKCHHRIAAAKELIVHIVRDEAPKPEPIKGSVHPEPVEGPSSVRAELPTSVHPEPVLSTVEGSVHPEPVEGSAHPGPVLSTVEGPVLSTVEGPVLSTVEGPVLSTVEGPVLSTVEGPVLSTVEGPVLSTVEGPVLSTVEGPVLSTVEGPVLSTVEGPVLSLTKEPNEGSGPGRGGPTCPPTGRPAEGACPGTAEEHTSSVHPEPVLSTVEEPALSLPKGPNEGSGPGRGGPTCPPTGRPAEGACPGTAEEHTSSVHPEPVLSTVEGPVLSTVEGPVLSTVEGPVLSTVEGSQQETNNSKPETLPVSRPRRRRTRTQRRREGAARAAKHRKALGSERIEEEKDEKPAPVELTPAERRIKERLEQHWHEPDPYGAPIDSTHPGRSPPW